MKPVADRFAPDGRTSLNQHSGRTPRRARPEKERRNGATMSFCEHCEGQRFDRARVLRALRQLRRDMSAGDRRRCDRALELVLETIRTLDIPHLDIVDDAGDTVH